MRFDLRLYSLYRALLWHYMHWYSRHRQTGNTQHVSGIVQTQRSTVIRQPLPPDDDSTSMWNPVRPPSAPFLFAHPTPSYLIYFVSPSFSFPIFGLCLLSVVHNSALSSCPLFALFNASFVQYKQSFA